MTKTYKDYRCALLGSRIRLSRHLKGLTRDQLAVLSGSSTGSIHKIEQGYIEPGIDLIIKIAKALDESIDWLLGDNNDRECTNNPHQ